MTKVSYLAGIPQDELKDRGKQVPNQPFIPYTHMTAGELRLTLLREQFRINAAFYPEDRVWQQGVSLIENKLYSGIHNIGAAYIGTLPQRLKPLINQIRKARKETKPANNKFVLGQNGIGQDPLIEQLDCEELLEYYTVNYPEEYGGPTEEVTPSSQAAYQKCLEENQMRKHLNEYLEGSAAHLLYEWVQNPNAQPPTVATKTILHKIGKDKISQVAEIDKELIRLWMRNGIMIPWL